MNNQNYFISRLVTLISPFSNELIKIELNGEESELRELLATIFDVNPKSIKGLRDSYNNYYTLSSAIKNPRLNIEPFNYFTVIIKEPNFHERVSSDFFPETKRIHSIKDINNIRRRYNTPNDFFYHSQESRSEEDRIYNNNDYSYNYNNYRSKSNKSIPLPGNVTKEDYLKFADFLFEKGCLYSRKELSVLKDLINFNESRVLQVLAPYLKSGGGGGSPFGGVRYGGIRKKIEPWLRNSGNSNNFMNNNTSMDENDNEFDESRSLLLNDYKNILDKIGHKINSKEKKVIENALMMENLEIINIFEKYESSSKESKDKNKLISKLKKYVENFKKNKSKHNNNTSFSENPQSESSNSNENSNSSINSENSSEDNKKYKGKSKKNNDVMKIEENDSQSNNNTHKKKDKKKITEKIEKQILKSFKDKDFDVSYFCKYDLSSIKDIKEKENLFKNVFNISISNFNNEGLSKSIKKSIVNYYNKKIQNDLLKDLKDEEKEDYNNIKQQKDPNLIDLYEEFLSHKKKSKLGKKIKKLIEEYNNNREQEEEESANEESEKNENESGEEESGNRSMNEVSDNEEDEKSSKSNNDNDSSYEVPDEDNNSNNSENSNKDDKDSHFITKGDKDTANNIMNANYQKNMKQKQENENNNKSNDIDMEKGIPGLVNFKKNKNKKTTNEENQPQEDSGGTYGNIDNNGSPVKKIESTQSITSIHKKMKQFEQLLKEKKVKDFDDDKKNEIIRSLEEGNQHSMDLFKRFQKNKNCLNKTELCKVYNKVMEEKNNNINLKLNKNDNIINNNNNGKPPFEELMDSFLKNNDITNKEYAYTLDQYKKNEYQLKGFYINFSSGIEDEGDFLEDIKIFIKKHVKDINNFEESKKEDEKFTPEELEVVNFAKTLKNRDKEDLKALALKMNDKKLISKELSDFMINYTPINEKENKIKSSFEVFLKDFDISSFKETVEFIYQKNKEKKEERCDMNYNEIIKKLTNEEDKEILKEMYEQKNEKCRAVLMNYDDNNMDDLLEDLEIMIKKYKKDKK